MALTIFWTDFAKKELKNIFDYHVERAGIAVAQKTVMKVVNETKRLKNHPRMGAIEENLAHRVQQFRYIVCGHYKVIYWVNNAENRIEINDIFDTRQDPIKLLRNE